MTRLENNLMANQGSSSNISSKRSSRGKYDRSKAKRSYYPAVFEAPNIDELKDKCENMVKLTIIIVIG
jgi:hypothetical protein